MSRNSLSVLSEVFFGTGAGSEKLSRPVVDRVLLEVTLAGQRTAAPEEKRRDSMERISRQFFINMHVTGLGLS